MTKKLDHVHSMELQNSLRTKIEKFASDIEKIGQGKLEFDSTSWLSVDTKFLSEVKTELLATSHADATTVWGSQVGKKYWELNKEKIREGMSCARVFIVSRTQVTGAELPRLIEIMENQHSGGVEVKVVMEESIDHRLRRDIAMFDKAILSHTMLTLGGYTSGTDVYWNPADVNPAIEDFDLL